MRSENGQIEGDLYLDDELQLYGQVTGKTVVEHGGVLHLFGRCTHGLIVKAGGKAVIHGMVSGSVRNEGGYLEVQGMVIGRITTISQGETIIGHSATV